MKIIFLKFNLKDTRDILFLLERINKGRWKVFSRSDVIANADDTHFDNQKKFMDKTSQEKKAELLNTTLVHEFLRCTEALNLFAYLVATLPKNDTKKYRLLCYNAYVDFLSHLYEFYIPLIRRDSKYKQTRIYTEFPAFNDKKDHEVIDITFNEEIQKLFRNRKNRIINGYPDSLGHRPEFYECEIPKEFGEHFRYVRNRRNHVDYRRASNEYDISLKDFFERYHKFVLILHEECRWTTQVDVNNFDWLAIDDFASEILK